MKLAIVIPAFKEHFFAETLRSIENQSCKDFHLYIGDDNSPYELKLIAESILNTVDYTYVKFTNNLGNKDLVGQWKRSINLCKDEDWIWLFSDDDVMSTVAVQSFYNSVYDSSLLIRLNKAPNIEKLDQSLGGIELEGKLLNFDSFIQNLKDQPISLPEFIFHRTLYQKVGIVNFPMAWNSDLATFLQMASIAQNILWLNKPLVFFRKSNLNISNKNNFVEMKNLADYKFLQWLTKFKSILNKDLHDILFSRLEYSFYRKLHGNYKAVIGPFYFIKIMLLNFKIFGLIKGAKNAFYLLKRHLGC